MIGLHTLVKYSNNFFTYYRGWPSVLRLISPEFVFLYFVMSVQIVCEQQRNMHCLSDNYDEPLQLMKKLINAEVALQNSESSQQTCS